ncbi:phosphate/phosphite/phosphonate ABC transporter substrate-binding protein [Synoicihabitans lomoniglobus]|uniref:PhnD/SsuA/transferrin family substrate-binding protein n=1 Tax=Synoicihabitans lomoniglobus TaxID=2909285 RepID=A0AAE9ZUY9_9BACT|nr:phosphate/phosphite/phosphonate ABC transporter substrate-binding protein [Opitutaceae bacterium LMO-M01]WED63265.1 PhnD/SsuA/transferrin family substrate-binding protein [Opitutaceae bacterium LMO-M01]
MIAALTLGPGQTAAASSRPAPIPAIEPETAKAQLRVGISRVAFRNTNINDATAAYRLFLEQIAARNGYDLDVETEIFDEAQGFGAALQRTENPVHMSIIVAMDFLQLAPGVAQQPMFVVSEGSSPGRHFVLLTRRDRGFDSLADLKGETLVNYNVGNGRQGWNWLNVLVAENGLGAIPRHFGAVHHATKPSRVILPVFFGTKAACLVDAPSLELMGELNPQVLRSLQTIARSELLADVVICVGDRGWPTAKHRTDTIDAIAGLAETSAGRQIMTLFKIDQILPYEPDYLDSVQSLLARSAALRPEGTL